MATPDADYAAAFARCERALRGCSLDVSECEVLDSISQLSWPGGGSRAPVVIEEEGIASRLADSAARDLDHGPDDQKRNNRGTGRI